FRSRAPMKPVETNTIADSIAVGVPRNWKKAVTAIAESGGTMINVADEEILDAMSYTGHLTGVFAEPAAATAIAGLKRALHEGLVPRKCRAVAVVTGSGLKDVRAAQQAAKTLRVPYAVAVPGLVNTHHLLFQTLTRACTAAANAELFDWLMTLYPRWARIDEEAVNTAALVGMAELMLSGCTTTTDHHYL